MWGGPLSISVYAPGDDFDRAMRKIQNLRYCLSGESSRWVREFVSFHLFFDAKHSPATSVLSKWENDLERGLLPDCKDVTETETDIGYKERLGLIYPVNVARNIARGRTYMTSALVGGRCIRKADKRNKTR